MHSWLDVVGNPRLNRKTPSDAHAWKGFRTPSLTLAHDDYLLSERAKVEDITKQPFCQSTQRYFNTLSTRVLVKTQCIRSDTPMSWQRILAFARKQGSPVVVSSDTGEDPLVLVSLAQVEAWMGENPQKNAVISKKSEIVEEKPVTIAPKTFQAMAQEAGVRQVPSAQQQFDTLTRSIEAVSEVPANSDALSRASNVKTGVAPSQGDLSIEERLFFAENGEE